MPFVVVIATVTFTSPEAASTPVNVTLNVTPGPPQIDLRTAINPSDPPSETQLRNIYKITRLNALSFETRLQPIALNCKP